MRARPAARAVAFAATVLAAFWAASLILIGGFDLSIGGWNISSHQPMRPILWGTIPLAVFVWANGIRKTADSWTRLVARLDHTLVAAGLSLTALAIGITYATTVAGGSDAYGYVSQADLWLHGSLNVPQPWAADVPWPRASWTFSPLGYRPPVDEGAALVPIYSPGLPLLMAAAKGAFGQPGVFLVVPLAGAVLVLTTWGIGRRLGESGAGLVAAWFVLASPAVLYMLALPMSDVPVAACWALVFFFALGRTTTDAVAAGIAGTLAIAIRPNLAWLIAIPALWLALPIRRLAAFLAPVTAAVVAIGVLFDRLYGSPMQSGYGDLTALFGLSHFGTNVMRYGQWLIETQTPLVIAGLAALALPVAAVWPAVRDRRAVRLMGVFVAGLWVFYCLYVPFDAWWFLRFALSAWPFMMLGLAAVLLAIARRYGAVGTVAVTWLIVVLGVYTFDIGRARGAFDLWQADRKFIAAAHAVQSLTPENSVVLSSLHSGSLRYYGGRTTMRFEFLDPGWLDRAIAWMASRGVATYALLESTEVERVAAQFAGQQAVLRLKGVPILEDRESGLALYSLSADNTRDTRWLTADPSGLWSVLPVRLRPPVFR